MERRKPGRQGRTSAEEAAHNAFLERVLLALRRETRELVKRARKADSTGALKGRHWGVSIKEVHNRMRMDREPDSHEVSEIRVRHAMSALCAFTMNPEGSRVVRRDCGANRIRFMEREDSLRLEATIEQMESTKAVDERWGGDGMAQQRTWDMAVDLIDQAGHGAKQRALDLLAEEIKRLESFEYYSPLCEE